MISVLHPNRIVKVGLSLTGSKSITNRLLILRSIYPSLKIKNKSESQDSVVLENALKSSSNIKDIDHAGTSMRFLTAFYSILENKEIIIKGSKRMHERPIYPLIDCLKLIGADISYLEKDGYPPIKIKGKKLNFRKVQISSNVSSQFVSAILLVAPKLIGGLVIELKGELISKPYIEMTLSLLNDLGIKTSFKGKLITVENLEKIKQKHIYVESDWSSASYWYSIVALSDGAEVRLNNFYKDSIQGDSVLTKYYKTLGVETKFTQNKIILTKLKDFTLPQQLNLNLIDSPDLAQTIAVTCFGLKINCSLDGLQTLNIKETKRLNALENELKKLGANVKVTETSLNLFEVKKIKKNIKINTYDDHRMAMSFAPLSLKIPIFIQNPSVVAKSYPKFWDDLKKAGFIIKPI
ncbi:MAG: 3-phosphoshikimate 1-carboxyvinyltransferase [Flavobacteriaceae bacterium TMED200]|nr:3-phosphoshikimate 1-carboxyvinyltransferase [Flavobacteriaceae bacterium]OUW66653.1 MAG: 3-phosphoshikimate 1-carboxyvinyltransferase [Flavobacteriaceae bacterium TMED200]|tara:strand:- start:34720 stop:35943 length:1224 start_codon:yes stop_codon:yes gene_type:complete